LAQDSIVDLLAQLQLEYIVCIHFPFLVPDSVLRLPSIGVLNLHPALLPFNRGWHTSSWAILDETPYGATLHFMNDRVDAGDVIYQAELPVRVDHTADALYAEIEDLEFDVFCRGWFELASGRQRSHPQDESLATTHKKSDLFAASIQSLDEEELVRVGDLLRRLRALTTNKIEESAYIERDGVRYRITLHVRRDDRTPEDGTSNRTSALKDSDGDFSTRGIMRATAPIVSDR